LPLLNGTLESLVPEVREDVVNLHRAPITFVQSAPGNTQAMDIDDTEVSIDFRKLDTRFKRVRHSYIFVRTFIHHFIV
jgi:hypothetical protein